MSATRRVSSPGGRSLDHLRTYGLRRLCSQMHKSHKANTLQLHKKVLQYRNSPIPNTNRSLLTPLLAPPFFQQQRQAWIQDIIEEHGQLYLPFHEPLSQVLDSRHLSLGNNLDNWKAWCDIFPFGKPTLCGSATSIEAFPNTTTRADHVASAVHTALATDPMFATMTQWCSQDTFFPAKALMAKSSTRIENG